MDEGPEVRGVGSADPVGRAETRGTDLRTESYRDGVEDRDTPPTDRPNFPHDFRPESYVYGASVQRFALVYTYPSLFEGSGPHPGSSCHEVHSHRPPPATHWS